MNKKVLVIKGESNAGVLRVAADRIAVGFTCKGYDVKTLDVTMFDLTDHLQKRIFLHEIVEEEYAFVFAIQCIGIGDITINGKDFLRVMKTPVYIGWIFDDVMYHYHRLLKIKKEDTNFFTFFVDDEMRNVISWMTPYIQRDGHLLHGGFESQEGKKKDIDILYPGNLIKAPDIKKMIPKVDEMPILRKIAEDTIHLLTGERCELSIREGLRYVLSSLGEEWDEQIHYELTSAGVIEYLDVYIRYLYRVITLEELLRAGFSVTVVGSGYKEVKEKWGEALAVLGNMDICEVTALMGRSKIVCNPCPPVFKKGVHERIFSAMLNRAVCFTPYSKYQDELMGDYVLFYKINDSIGMKNILDDYFSHYSEWREKKEENMYQYAKEHHTWEKRGEQIIDYYEKHLMASNAE